MTQAPRLVSSPKSGTGIQSNSPLPPAILPKPSRIATARRPTGPAGSTTCPWSHQIATSRRLASVFLSISVRRQPAYVAAVQREPRVHRLCGGDPKRQIRSRGVMAARAPAQSPALLGASHEIAKKLEARLDEIPDGVSLTHKSGARSAPVGRCRRRSPRCARRPVANLPRPGSCHCVPRSCEEMGHA